MADRGVFVLLAGLLLLGASVVSNGTYSIDEVVYLAGAQAFHQGGSLVVENGYTAFRSDHLLLWLMRDGPNGVTPQYPVGTAILGGLLEVAFGSRALIVANASAAAATLFVVRALAIALFADTVLARRAILILVFSSFWLEFAFGIWPHAISTLLVTLAVLCTWNSLASTSGLRWATMGGAAVGVAVLFRTDSVLVLSLMVMSTILVGERPFRLLYGLVLGLAPGLVVAALVNHFKFGSFNPLSYGVPGDGSVALAGHVIPIVLGAVITLVLVIVRVHGCRRYPRRWFLLGGAVLVAATLLIPQVRDVLVRYAHGLLGLVIDSRAIVDDRIGVAAGVDGTLAFWGLPKKALGQSLPWVGLVCFVLPGFLRSRERRAIGFMLAGCVMWSLPYILRSWHGGLGSNMRYFLPVVPLMTVLAAYVWRELTTIASARLRVERMAPWFILPVVLAWSEFGPGGVAGVHQILPGYLLAVIALFSVLAAMRLGHQQAFARAALGTASCGFILAGVLAGLDLAAAQERREFNRTESEVLGSLPSPSLVVGVPETLMVQMERPDDLVAIVNYRDGRVAGSLLVDALNRGYRVFVDSAYVNAIHDPDEQLVRRRLAVASKGRFMMEMALKEFPDSAN